MSVVFQKETENISKLKNSNRILFLKYYLLTLFPFLLVIHESHLIIQKITLISQNYEKIHSSVFTDKYPNDSTNLMCLYTWVFLGHSICGVLPREAC